MRRREPVIIAADLFGNETKLSFRDVGHWSPSERTLVDELETLRAYMAKRDVDPLHNWNPCRGGTRCQCRPGLTAEHAVGRRLWRESLKRRVTTSR